MIEAKQATPHQTLIMELMDSRIPKTEREHAAVREIERLRQAIEKAEQAQPVAEIVPDRYGYASFRWLVDEGRDLAPSAYCGHPIGTKFYTAPPQTGQAEKQEPDYYGLTADHLWMSISKKHYDKLKPEFRMACYTAPPQRKPLTDARIAKALSAAGLRPEDYREDGMIEPLVRAVEAEHQIKE